MCPFIIFLSLFLGYFDLGSCHLTFGAGSLTETLLGNDIDDVFNFTFTPDQIDKLYEGKETMVLYNLTASYKENVTRITIFPEDDKIVEVSKNATIEMADLKADEQMELRGSFGLRGKRLGKTVIKFRTTVRTQDPKRPGSTVVGPGYRVIVLRHRRVVDDVFRYGIIVLACVLYIGFGCKIDLEIIWTILRRPLSPAIGMGCQFILMPLLGFGISRMLNLADEYAFGLLTMAASPGGGSSNVWVSLLGGDLDLSLTMTTMSTFGALGMMPFWMFFVGRLFVDSDRLAIPYWDIFRSLLTIVIPCLVGLLIKKFLPKVADFIAKITRPFSGIFVLYILSFGTYVNIYMYIIMGTVPKVIVAAILLPLLGYSIAFVLAIVLRRTSRSAVTISIETGVQNASIPIIMLQGNFLQPEGDLGAVMPVATSLFTQFPIMFAWLGLLVYRKCRGNPEEDTNMAHEMTAGKGDGRSYDLQTSDTSRPRGHSANGAIGLPNGIQPVAEEGADTTAFSVQDDTRF